MSDTSIPSKTKVRLWMAAGGRCQYPGCNKALYRDELSLTEMNRSNIAHIIADKPGGPRGDVVLSGQLAAEFSNLMLMCYDHHHLIDHDGVTDHPVEVLREMKAEHERRIEVVTGIQSDRKTDILIYTAPIGDYYPRVTFAEASVAVLANRRYPASPHPFVLGRGNSQVADSQQMYWSQEEQHLRTVVNERIIPPIVRGDIGKPSIFAIAPQPLLMLLGHLIRDISAVDVYQRHREPQPGWVWQDHPEGFEYSVERPRVTNGTPTLVLALSSSIKDDRVFARIPGADIWRITVSNPNTDFLKSAIQLRRFRELCRPLMDEIKDHYPNGTMLNIFPSAPVSVCVEFGRLIQPKAHMSLRLWDENKDLGGFVHAFDINSPDGGAQ